MYDVFRKNRGLKILLVLVLTLVGSYLLYPAINLIKGRRIEEASLIGSYSSGEGHQVVIYPESLGRLVSPGHAEDFSFSYLEGTIYCNGEETVWTMKALGDGNIYSLYDHTYLYKR